MTSFFPKAALAAAVLTFCANTLFAVDPVTPPAPNDPGAYQPQPYPKPLPPPGYDPDAPPAPAPAPQAAQIPGQAPSIGNEAAFVQAYVAHRSPRIMVFVNRTITGDPLPKDNLDQLIRADGTPVANPIGATAEDYELIEMSIVKYFDNSGKVDIQDADAARAKLDREKILRIENGDPAACRLLNTELQQDIVIRITAQPTNQSSYGQAIRILAKAVGTTDAHVLGTAFVDMPLPMSKTNINVFTRYLAEQLMGDMAHKWSNGNASDPIEVRIYKTATVDDALKIRKWLQQTPGVAGVNTRGATGGSTTSYASFAVSYAGAPEDLYATLQTEIGESQGMKAVDVQNNTIDLEMTGKLNLVTTTQKTETTTTTTVKTVEEKKIEPINPAAPETTPAAQ